MKKEDSMENKILKEVIDIIALTCGIDKKDIKGNSNLLTDLELESLDVVDLIVAFEEKYEIEIVDQDIKNFQTVNDIVEYIKSHV